MPVLREASVSQYFSPACSLPSMYASKWLRRNMRSLMVLSVTSEFARIDSRGGETRSL